MTTASQERTAITTTELATRWGMTSDTLRRLHRLGRLQVRPIVLAGGAYRWSLASIVAAEARGLIPPEELGAGDTPAGA